MQHFHTDEPLVQVGWLGQSGRFYGLEEDVTELGGFSPIYQHWGEKCGHQIQSEDMSAAVAQILDAGCWRHPA